MAKNKTSKGPDAFQQELQKDFRWVVENSAILAVVAAVLVVAGLAYAGFDYFKKQQNEKAQAEYFQVENAYLAKVDEAREKLRADEKEATAELDYSKLDLSTEVEGFKKVITEFEGSKAAAMAALQLSEIYVQQGQNEEALNVIETVSAEVDSDHLVGALLVHRLGTLKAQSGNCEAAIESFQKMLSASELKYLHAEAQLKIGLCYEKLGNKDQAREAYQSASELAPEQSAGVTATQYLRLLERQSGEG